MILGGACAERQDGGKVCPALCPEQDVPTLDTVIDAIGVSQSVAPYPGLGAEATLLLASRGDSLDVRAVIRFDSIPKRHRTHSLTGDTTTALTTFVDSAELRLRVDTTAIKISAPVTVTLYNVDTTSADTNTTALAGLFRLDRQIGTRTYSADSARDTLRIPIDTAYLRARVQGGGHVRIGIQVTSSASVQMHVFSSLTDLGPSILFDPSPDTATHVGSYRPVSLTPADNDSFSRDLADFNLIVTGNDPIAVIVPGGSVPIRVGGLPARRGYLRFDLPSRLVDSTTVVRATLSLTQIPTTRFDTLDKLKLYAHSSIATGVIAAPEKAALLIGGIIDSAVVQANGDGVVDLDLVRLFRRWRLTKPTEQPRVLILRTSTEGASPIQLRFYDVNAASGLRPRIRITYVPRVDFGLP